MTGTQREAVIHVLLWNLDVQRLDLDRRSRDAALKGQVDLRKASISGAASVQRWRLSRKEKS